MGKTLFPDASRGSHFVFDPNDLTLIEDPKHVLYDSRVSMPLDETLVLNIMVHGVIEPVVIVRVDDTPVVIAGRQRVRAAREANRRLKLEGKQPIKVRCIHREGEERDRLGVMISENELRQDNGPLAKARLCARYLGMNGGDHADAATVFGVTSKTTHQWMQFLELDATVIRAVDNNKLSFAAAMELHGLASEAQKEKLHEMLGGNAAPREFSTDGLPGEETFPAAPAPRPTIRVAREAAGKTTHPTKRAVKKVIEDVASADGKPTEFVRGVLAALRWVALGDKCPVKGRAR